MITRSSAIVAAGRCITSAPPPVGLENELEFRVREVDDAATTVVPRRAVLTGVSASKKGSNETNPS